MKDLSELKEEIRQKFTEFRLKRSSLFSSFRKKLEEKKMQQIKNSIQDK